MKNCLVCQLLLIAAAPAGNAAVVLDQQFMLPANSGVNYYHDYPGDYLAQTFTVRTTGRLAGVGVQASVSGSGEFVDDLHVRVTRVDANGYALMNDVLAEAAINPSALPIAPSVSPATMTDVDLSSWQVPVATGDRLAILLSSEHAYYSPRQGAHYAWFFQLHNPHAGGEFSIYSPQLYGPTPLRDIWLGGGDMTVDAGFRVYVDPVPEPRGILILTCAAACCLLFRRRFR